MYWINPLKIHNSIFIKYSIKLIIPIDWIKSLCSFGQIITLKRISAKGSPSLVPFRGLATPVAPCTTNQAPACASASRATRCDFSESPWDQMSSMHGCLAFPIKSAKPQPKRAPCPSPNKTVRCQLQSRAQPLTDIARLSSKHS